MSFLYCLFLTRSFLIQLFAMGNVTGQGGGGRRATAFASGLSLRETYKVLAQKSGRGRFAILLRRSLISIFANTLLLRLAALLRYFRIEVQLELTLTLKRPLLSLSFLSVSIGTYQSVKLRIIYMNISCKLTNFILRYY